jgi:hypothetical protein
MAKPAQIAIARNPRNSHLQAAAFGSPVTAVRRRLPAGVDDRGLERCLTVELAFKKNGSSMRFNRYCCTDPPPIGGPTGMLV